MWEVWKRFDDYCSLILNNPTTLEPYYPTTLLPAYSTTQLPSTLKSLTSDLSYSLAATYDTFPRGGRISALTNEVDTG